MSTSRSNDRPLQLSSSHESISPYKNTSPDTGRGITYPYGVPEPYNNYLISQSIDRRGNEDDKRLNKQLEGMEQRRPHLRPDIPGNHHHDQTTHGTGSMMANSLLHDVLPGSERPSLLRTPVCGNLPPLPKKARLDPLVRNRSSQPMWTQPLTIDTSMDNSAAVKVKLKMQEPPLGYHPEVEAISPTLPTESQAGKSDVVQSISQVDSKINAIENQITLLKKTQERLEAEAQKPKEVSNEEEASSENKPLSLAQIIYKENQKKAKQAHEGLKDLGPPLGMLLYNQPSDLNVYHENRRKFSSFREVLKTYFKQQCDERNSSQNSNAEAYENRVINWLKKVDARTVKKTVKDQKVREYYEKVFPEIKKQREDKERFQSRVGSRAGGSGYARTEAELEQIMDGLQEQEEEERKMRTYAIIPPLLSQIDRPKHKFINENGLIREPMAEYNERKQIVSAAWSTQERDVFKEKFLDRPKIFWQIAEVCRKSVPECVQYYYLSKKTETYKAILKKQIKRQPRKPQLKTGIQRNSNEEAVTPVPMSENSNIDAVGSEDEGIGRLTRSAIEESQPHKCAACETVVEHMAMSHPVTRLSCMQYGLDERLYQPDWRVCTGCKCKSVRKRCPIPLCQTPKKKVRHLRALPVKWAELSTEMREKVLQEIGLTEDMNRCCSNCYNRLAALAGKTDDPFISIENQEDTDLSVRWTEEEIGTAKQGICTYGKDWASIASLIGSKTETQCKNFYFNYKKKYNLDVLVLEYKKKRAEQNRAAGLSDIEFSDLDDSDEGNVEDNDDSSDLGDIPVPRSLQHAAAVMCSSTTSNPSACLTTTSAVQALVASVPFTNGQKTMIPPASVPVACTNQPEPMNTSVAPPNDKPDYDSSATASADECPQTDQVTARHIKHEFHYRMKTEGDMPLPVKQEPAIDMTTEKQDSRPDQQLVHPQIPPGNSSASTSVKDLIDLAIEDALTNPNASDLQDAKSVLHRSIHAPQVRPLGGMAYESELKPMKTEKDAETMHQRQLNPPGYKGDPREGFPMREALSFSRSSELTGPRAPPPAHSHHQSSAHDLRQDNLRQDSHRQDGLRQDGKSPASFDPAQFSPYDKRCARSPALPRSNIAPPGPPPPLISNHGPNNRPGSNLHSHLSASNLPVHVKREALAGGSILQGTPLSQNQNSSSRYEQQGSISHGTPRYDSLAHTPPSSREEVKRSRSPRPPSNVSAASANLGQQQQLEAFRMMEQQQKQAAMIQLQMAQMDMFRRGGLPNPYAAGGIPFAGLYDPYNTKSVLQSDYLTAQQMMTAAIADKDGKLSPRTKESLFAAQAAVPPGMMDPSVMMMMTPRITNHRMFTEQQRRLLSPANPAASRSSPLPKEDLQRTWQPQSSQQSSGRGDTTRLTASIIPGMPKNIDMIRNERDQRSLSPLHRQDEKTKYQKEMEDIKRQYERNRTDSERTLTDNESSNQGSLAMREYRSPLPPARSDPRIVDGLSRSDHMARSELFSRADHLSRSEGHVLDRADSSGFNIFGCSPYAGHSRDSRQDLERGASGDRMHLDHTRSASTQDREREERRLMLEENRQILASAQLSKESLDIRRIGEQRVQSLAEEERRKRGAQLLNPSVRGLESGDSRFASRRLAEVSKGLHKEAIHKEASALFSSSFEKEKPPSVHSSSPQQFTAASIIDAIITKQINNEGPSTTTQHTSVIVPPKKQRFMQHSHSDSDLAAKNEEVIPTCQQSNGAVSSPVSVRSVSPVSARGNKASSTSSLSNTVERKHITLTDHIHDIINKDYIQKTGQPRGMVDTRDSGSYSGSERSKTSSSLRPYRVEDVEPISPPSANHPFTKRHSKPSNAPKLSGIRSLLNAPDSEPPKITVDHPKQYNFSDGYHHRMYGELSPMDYVKNKIEEAIRNGVDCPETAKTGNILRPPIGSQASAFPLHLQSARQATNQQPTRTLTEKAETIDLTCDEESKSRTSNHLDVRSRHSAALSLARARSPEEVDVYTSMASRMPLSVQGSYKQNHASSRSSSSGKSFDEHQDNNDIRSSMEQQMDRKPEHLNARLSHQHSLDRSSPHQSPLPNRQSPKDFTSQAQRSNHFSSQPMDSRISAMVSGSAVSQSNVISSTSNYMAIDKHASKLSHRSMFDSSGMTAKPLLSEQYETLSDDES